MLEVAGEKYFKYNNFMIAFTLLGVFKMCYDPDMFSLKGAPERKY